MTTDAPSEGPTLVDRYPRALQALHWAMALLVCVQFTLILVLRQLQSLELGQMVLSAHRQCGAIVLLLMLVRVGLSLTHRAPKAIQAPAWQVIAAKVVHLATFVLLLAQPVLGFLVAWARGDDVIFAGVVHMPALVRLPTEQGEALSHWHRDLAYGLMAFVLVHLAAVVFNRLVRKVSVVERMLPAPSADKVSQRVPLVVQLGLCCGGILALTLTAGLYAAGQYSAFDKQRAVFDDTEVTVLDDLRSAQLAVKGLAADPSGAAGALSTVQAFPGRLPDQAAKAAAELAVAAMARVAGGDASALPGAETQLQAAVDAQFMRVFQKRLDLVQVAARGHDMIILTLAPTVMISALLAFLLARSLLAALGQARAVVGRVEAGAPAEAIRVEGHGEMALLMRDILAMRDAIQRRQQRDHELQAGQQSELANLAREQQAREAEAARAHAEEQTAIVEAMRGALSALARGQFQQRLATAFPGEYEHMRTDLNATMSRLEEVMGTITGAVSGIGSGSRDIERAASDLSRRAENEAATLAETAAALGEITEKVRCSTASALTVAEAAAAAQAEASESREMVDQTIQAMDDIQASSKQISQIVGVINEIAFQTNLLALNAGVEAARAGDAGRGFAIVAQEVRALAQRSATAASDIKGLIATSDQRVGAGVALVGRTGDTLNRIAGQVISMGEGVADIAGSAREQSQGLDLVNRAVGQLGSVVHQNAAMAEEASAAIGLLNDETARLDQLVRMFDVDSQAEPRRRRA
jgi:methyl-accepting chemotaxis protein